MTTDCDFDVIARAWLDLMPDEAPDRTVAAVLQAVDTTPQVRRPIRWPTWRSTTMNRLSIALGAAAVVVVAGTLVLSQAGAPPSVGATPSPIATIASHIPSSPVATPSSSVTAVVAPIPPDLIGRWMGAQTDPVSKTAGTTILFNSSGLGISQSNTGNVVVLTAAASSIGSGRFQLESMTSAACSKGNIGTYSWTRSASGRTLTISAERDDCAARSTAVAGQWWRMGCDDPNDYCLGVLDAGTYASEFIAPRLEPGAKWAADFGALSYRVPDGWANSGDWPESLDLVPAGEYPPADGTDPPMDVHVVTQPTAADQGTPCSEATALGVSQTVSGIAKWLQNVPGLVATSPKAITIDGHAGQWLDLRVDPAWKRGCDSQTTPIVTYLNPTVVGVGGAERARLILVDLGGGHVVGVVIRTADPTAFDAFVSSAMPIVQSFTFK
jgi:hypothetical protein